MEWYNRIRVVLIVDMIEMDSGYGSWQERHRISERIKTNRAYILDKVDWKIFIILQSKMNKNPDLY